jgi:hypothetical protein
MASLGNALVTATTEPRPSNRARRRAISKLEGLGYRVTREARLEVAQGILTVRP